MFTRRRFLVGGLAVVLAMVSRRLLVAGGGGSYTAPLTSLTPPIRGGFYFPWYPEAWDQLGYTPFTRYTPTLGAYYDQHDQAVINQHLSWALDAKLDAIIPTWRGRPDSVGISAATFGDTVASDPKIVAFMEAARATALRIAMLYEVEAYATPTLAQVQAEFDWLAANRFTHPNYLRVGGLPVIFVYTGEDHNDTLAQKYSDATSGFTTAYVMMQTVTNPAATSPQPQGWFIFTNARTAPVSNSYSICPGYWRIDETNPVTTRVLSTWQANIASMVASGADWQLVNSFNEWGEGSQVEPETTHGTDYLDALANG